MAPIKNNLPRANAARIIFYLLTGMSIILLFSNILQYQLLSDVKNGIAVSHEAAAANDLRQVIISAINILLLLASTILFLVWTYRAYDNLYILKKDEMSTTPGWAVGYWFVPVLSLFKPYLIMKEIWDETKTYPMDKNEKWDTSGGGIVGLWWTCSLLSVFSSYFVAFIFTDKTSLDGLLNLTFASICSNIVLIIAKVVTLVMLNKIVALEKNLWAFVNTPVEPVNVTIPGADGDSMNVPRV
ncbi:MAG: hypothetical protein JWO09_342 [Bacteroidetes bacterium]|nr:hypothetical protein [Bacteroidota bacterium]